MQDRSYHEGSDAVLYCRDGTLQEKSYYDELRLHPATLGHALPTT